MHFQLSDNPTFDFMTFDFQKNNLPLYIRNNIMTQKQEDFFKRLKEELIETTESWPLDYLYKFIVPNDKDKIQQIESAFDGLHAKIATKQSGKGNFVSVSVRVIMPDADTIINKYKQVSSIEGIISL